MLLTEEPQQVAKDSKDHIEEAQKKDAPDVNFGEASALEFCNCEESSARAWMTPRSFLIDSKYFLTKCTKPDGHGTAYIFWLTEEFKMTFGAIWQGFLIMGCLAFVIKLVHFPFNQMLVQRQ
jgi:preprotein translocase subunit Sss1